ncbi:MAG: TlpA family protein disulfide reductase [Spirosomaceae bacterium]|nr:TlpA family protein disulfide reductase [Spirosomataceae bacterium]
MRFFVIILLLATSNIHAQKVREMRFDEFEQLTKINDSKTYVFNFWATWCKPCIAELPNFIKVADEYQQNIEVIFVSLDFVRDKQKVEQFVIENRINSRVVLLNEPDYDSWINRVNPVWSGALPATLILNKNKREFYEQSFDYQQLVDEIRHFF